MSGERRHLFLLTSPATFGEAVMGLDIARALHAEGDGVGFLFPLTLHNLFRDVPFPYATIDQATDIVGAALATMQAFDFGTLVLIDVLSVFGSTPAGTLRAFLDLIPGRVVGLDCWNLPGTDLAWDTGSATTPLDPVVLDVPCLRPCPLVHPDAPGAYGALPAIEPLAPDERARVRREAGIEDGERWVITATAIWQHHAYHRDLASDRLARGFPELFELIWRRLDGRVRLDHVGPAAFTWASEDGRYRWRREMPPAEFRRLLAACDLYLSLNVSASSVAAAVACGVPALVLSCSLAGDTVDAVEARAGRPLAEEMRRWLARVVPLFPFRICPVGGYRFTEAALARNPYREAFREVELTDLDAVAAAIHELTGDEPARAALRDGQARFRALSASLPSAATRVRELLAAAARR